MALNDNSLEKIDKQNFEKTLYKYREADLGIKMLCEQCVKITKPSELNDPFELIPSLNFLEDKYLENFTRIVMRMKNETAVFSLSEDPLDNCMWAHYADDFKGICIGFSTKYFFKEDLYKVDYKLNRPSLGEIEFEELNFFIMDLMLSKSHHWKNEEEYRYLFTLSGEHIKKDLILPDFESKSITELIVGPRICKNSLERLKKILE